MVNYNDSGFYLTPQASQDAWKREQQERLAKRQEQLAKRQKDMMDFYRTTREYLSPSQAYAAAKKQYPDLPDELANSNQPDKDQLDIQSKLLGLYGKQQDIALNQTAEDRANKKSQMEEQLLPTEIELKKAETEKARGEHSALTAMQSMKTQNIKSKVLFLINQNKVAAPAKPPFLGVFGGNKEVDRNPTQLRDTVEASLSDSEASMVNWDDPDIQAALTGEKPTVIPTGKSRSFKVTQIGG